MSVSKILQILRITRSPYPQNLKWRDGVHVVQEETRKTKAAGELTALGTLHDSRLLSIAAEEEVRIAEMREEERVRLERLEKEKEEEIQRLFSLCQIMSYN